MLTPEEIRNKTFEKGFNGYRSDEVDDFLDKLCADYEHILKERDAFEGKLEALAEKLEEYRQDEEAMRSAIVGAQKLGDSIVKESREKAQDILSRAQKQADDAIKNIQVDIEREQRLLGALKKEVSDFKENLLKLYKQHLGLISELPEYEAPKSARQVDKELAAAPVPKAEETAEPEEIEDEAELPVEPEAVPEEKEPEMEKPRVIEFAAQGAKAIGHTMELDELHDDDIIVTDVVSDAGIPAEERPKSKFGQLKFGSDFTLSEKDRDPPPRGSLFSRRKR